MSDTPYCTGCGYHAALLADHIEELEAENKRLRLEVAHANDTADAAIERTKELEAKLACNTPTLQEAAKVLLPLAESRTLPFYLVEMPLTKDGNGPADIGIDASEMSYEVWEAGTLSTFGGARQLSSAIPEWLRTLAELKG